MTILLQGAGLQSLVVAPSGPQFSAAEVGTINASTVAVTFDSNISASDYGAGVTIKINGTATSITSATRQSNHAIVRYVIPVLWHGSGDAVTWEYASGSGNIVSEADSTPLGNVTAQSVTNNCEYVALLDLQADTLALNDSDPVSTWADQSGQSHNFTQTGTARPTRQTIDGYPAVVFDHVDDWMLGGEFADNLASFTIIAAGAFGSIIISKINNTSTGAGWDFSGGGSDGIVQEDGGSNWLEPGISPFETPFGHYISTFEVVNLSIAGCKLYLQGSNANGNDNSAPPVSNYSTSEPVRLCTLGVLASFSAAEMNSVLFLTVAPSATNRAALEARLAARYGITL